MAKGKIKDPAASRRGIKLATLQSSGVFGLRFASVGVNHAPLAHNAPRGIYTLFRSALINRPPDD